MKLFKKLFLYGLLFYSFIFSVDLFAQAPTFDWGGIYGDIGIEEGISVATGTGYIVTAGNFYGTIDGDLGPSALYLTSVGSQDIYITKLDNDGNLIWAKSIGGVDVEKVTDIKIDPDGNIFILGQFGGICDFDPSAATFNLTPQSGAFDVFILKLDMNGDFIWSKPISGPNEEKGWALELDILGNLYVTGSFSGTTDFDPGAGVASLSAFGDLDMFFMKIDYDGIFVWAKQLGGTSEEQARDIAVDNLGNIYITGFMVGQGDYDPSATNYTLNINGAADIVFAKYNSNGDLIWANNIGSTGNNFGMTCDTDMNGNLVIGGYYSDVVDFDLSGNDIFLNATPSYNMYLMKYDAFGNFVWVNDFPGGSNTGATADVCQNLLVDDFDNIYMTGFFYNTVDFDPSAASANLTSSGGGTYDVFAAKYDVNGQYVWATSNGSGGFTQGNGIAKNSIGDIFVTGKFDGVLDLDPFAGTFLISALGSDDAFIQKLTECATTYQIIFESACDTYTSPSGNYIWTSSGIYNDTIPNNAGCDSVITIDLTILNSTSGSESVSACDSYVWPTDGNTYTSSGTYTSLLTGSNGCDSTAILDLTIGYTDYVDQYVSACDSYLWPETGLIYNTTGAYAVYLTNSMGCDSIITLFLSIGNTTSVSITIPSSEICENNAPIYLDDFVTPAGGFWTGPGINGSYFDPALAGAGDWMISYYYYDGGCFATNDFTFNVHPVPSVFTTSTNASCTGSDGSVDATISGGTAPYTIYWNNGEVTEDISNLSSGMYFITVTDDEGCSGSGSAMVETAGLSLNAVATGVDCFGDSDGSIDLTVTSSAGVQSIVWTNGATTEDISNLAAGYYEVIVTDVNGCESPGSFEVTSPEEIFVGTNSTNATCGANDGAIAATVTGGTSPLDYQWYDALTATPIGTNSPNLNSIGAGPYFVIITDDNGCTEIHNTSVSDAGGPIIIVNSITPAGCADDGEIDIAINASNPIATIDWSNGDNTEDINGLAQGFYSVIVTDVEGCVGMGEADVPGALPAVQSICLVTVDTLTNTNLLVWEKPISSSIDHFNIYRETSVAGVFILIDSVDYSDESVYNDITAFPQVRSWRYKLSAVNICGQESIISEFHRTIHLTISFGLGNTVNLNWDNYEGFAFGTFDVWRHTNTFGWEYLQGLPSTNFSYTDSPPNINGLDYIVSISPPATCTSTTGKVQDHNSSRSNKSSSITGDLVKVEEEDKTGMTSVYPNPSNGNFNVVVVPQNDDSYDGIITDAQGRVIYEFSSSDVMTEIDLSNFSDGIYNLQILVDDQVINRKLIKN